jgi:hypothetical protein
MPQFVLDVERSTHAPVQLVVLFGHVVTHALPAHATAHVFPHIPQFLGSDVVSTQPEPHDVSGLHETPPPPSAPVLPSLAAPPSVLPAASEPIQPVMQATSPAASGLPPAGICAPHVGFAWTSLLTR